jgi:FkbH-like protein
MKPSLSTSKNSAEAKAVRLVIWDLDETFWHGTLTEGGCTYNDENHKIVMELASRGILSSICSKNDFSAVRKVLEERGIWDYFIFPSINWDAKGPRLATLIESVQLRPETVLFIDDNPTNLNEALHFVPGLQITNQTFISDILCDHRFKGKDDSSLSRLKQYKILEKRKEDEVAAGKDNIEFLRSSNIRISIDYDIESNIDRAIELINRTNQLNFTKNRLPEDPEAAKTELCGLLRNHFVQAGLVRVMDNYGDYGFSGFYATANYPSGLHLLHYCFSCRTLGMGIETYVYGLLGRPQLTVQGEVLSNPIEEPRVDWIRISDSNQLEQIDSSPVLSGIYLRGGCDLMNIDHYARMLTPQVAGEYNIIRNGLNLRLDHTLIARYSVESIPADAMNAFAKIGYLPDDFKSKIFSTRPQGLWVLSFFPDFWVPVYRHNLTGALIPFVFVEVEGVQNPTEIPREERHSLIKNPHMLRAIEVLERDFTYQGFIAESDFKENLRVIFDVVPKDSLALVILNKEFHGARDIPEAAHKPTVSVNKWTAEVASEYAKVEIVPMTQFVQSPGDILEDNHFNRMVYFRLFNFIKDRATQLGPSAERDSSSLVPEVPLIQKLFRKPLLQAVQPDLVLESFGDIGAWKAWLAEHRWMLDLKVIDSYYEHARENGVSGLWLGQSPASEIILRGTPPFQEITIHWLLSRHRAMLDLIRAMPMSDAHGKVRIYAAEASSVLAMQLRGRYPRFIGSEYLPENPEILFPIEHQDVTKLTYPSSCFDIAVTQEVLEHVPDLSAALRELGRILRPGGVMLSTFPWRYMDNVTQIMARLVDGRVEHLVQTPEYHHDPHRPEGVLVFQAPGWDILETARKCGFSRAEFVLYSTKIGGITGPHLAGIWTLVCEK